MPCIAYCADIPDSAELRKAHLAAHLDYITSIIEHVAVAGPLRSISGQAIEGSCFVYLTDDFDLAAQLLEDDPYQQCGLYQQVQWQQFTGAAGQWVGGCNW